MTIASQDAPKARIEELKKKLLKAEQTSGYWSLEAGLVLLELLDCYEVSGDEIASREAETRSRAIILINFNMMSRSQGEASKIG